MVEVKTGVVCPLMVAPLAAKAFLILKECLFSLASSLQHIRTSFVLMMFCMTVGTDQFTLLDFVPQPIERQSFSFSDIEVFRGWVFVMELENDYISLAAVDTLAAQPISTDKFLSPLKDSLSTQAAPRPLVDD